MRDGASATVFLNPCAGGGKAARKAGEVRRAFGQLRFAAKIIETRSSEEFQAQVREELAKGGPRLAAMGGDGTLQLLVREAIGCDVQIGVIPAGGGNDFAAALGIVSIEQAVKAIVQGRTKLVDVVKVKFADGKEAHYVGGGGAGLDAEAARLASGRFMKWPGRLRYLAAAIAALRKYSGMQIELKSGERDLEEASNSALLAAALNTPSYGGGVRLAPGASVDDGVLDFVVVKMPTRLEIVKLLPRLLVTGELNTKGIRRFRAASARLCAGAEMWFHGDGELLGMTPVEIEVEPKAIRMLVP